MFDKDFLKQLQIKYPIIQAPMAGGVTTSRLVAEVSNLGGIGMIGAGYMTPNQTRAQIQEVRGLTSNHFGVNLFVPKEFQASESDIDTSHSLLQPIRDQLGIQNNKVEIPTYRDVLETFNEQVKIVLEEKVPICSFTFGLPSNETVAELKQQNIILIGTATTVREAMEIENSGMDMVVVQGSEAGGHRGDFIDGQESLVGLMSLIPQVVDKVSIPVIAAGGIMDGRGVMAAICLGAKGVQLGTAFLTCVESGAHQVHKEAVMNASEDQIVLTRAFSGKWARGIKNKFISDMREHENSFPDFPIQNTLTQDVRRASSVQNNPDYMSLWSGQSPNLAKIQTVESLMKDIIDQCAEIKNIF